MGGSKLRSSAKKIAFSKAVNIARKALIRHKPKTSISAANIAINALKPYKKHIKQPTRIIPVPKRMGGFIGIASILGALGALGSLAGGASAVAKSINDAKNAKSQLEEQKRHNIAMESTKVGNGVYLAPYRKGCGFFLKPYNSKNC
jgi:hypothetical protein